MLTAIDGERPGNRHPFGPPAVEWPREGQNALSSISRSFGIRRSEHRIPLDTDATLMHAGRMLTVRLNDLSRGGAAGSGVRPPPKDAAVALELGSLTVRARIAWTDGSRFGLRFDSRLRATDVFLVSGQSR